MTQVIAGLKSDIEALECQSYELQQVRDSSTHQKKRVIDMMTNLMKDLADIGSSIGSEFKVCCCCNWHF